MGSPHHSHNFCAMSDEELFRGFQEGWPHLSPLWNMLWPPVGFCSDSTFEENIDRLLPRGEIRDRFKQFFEGKRWHISELGEECREKFEFFMLDYRSGACFVHSRQVDDYAFRVLKIDLGAKLPDRGNSVLMNDTAFDWSDTVEKAREFVKEKIPTGADTVMYLLLKCFNSEDGFICLPEPINVYFHGEDVAYYRHLPHSMLEHYRPWYVGQDDEIPLLVALALEENSGFLSQKWTIESINEAVEYIESELSCMKKSYATEEVSDYYQEHLRGEISILEKSLDALESLDDYWSVSERIGISERSYPDDDALIKDIEYMEKFLGQQDISLMEDTCNCGNSPAKDCEWKKCGKCCQGCRRHKKRKRS